MIKTVKEFVEALGGPRAVAEHLNVGETAVRMAYTRGIPGAWQLRLYKLAQRRKIKVAPELLGLPTQERN